MAGIASLDPGSMPNATRPSRFRLATDVRPSDYHLHLEPDLATGRFRGEVRIDVQLARPRTAIVLHAADLVVEHADAERDGEVIPLRTRLDRRHETVSLRAARPLPAGPVALRLRFSGALNRHLRGLYAAGAGEARYAFTQCEAADARRIFPCFDEPAFKARFHVAVTARATDTVLGNGPVVREQSLGDGRRTVHCAATPPLSTYLFALAVGPLEASAVRHVGATPIRLWHVPGKGHLTAFGLEAGAESLARLEDYFGIPYPYAKLDLVAVPDFEAGAMENAGAVFFRETLLLVDPATVSLPERKRAAEVIAHELAHMWYGDLVTMAWWDDLWLNEAFATWMAYRVVDEWMPAWRMWQGFEHNRASALALDGLASTHPIYAPVHSVAQATENFDLITYEKGAAVVRMIEQYLGARVFRDGVRRYMRRHREGNAVAADLWRALGEASGTDVTRVARTWIEQPGFPLVDLARTGQRLRVRQERFFADPTVPAATRRQRWPVPMVVRTGARGAVRALADKASQTVSLGAARAPWCYGNAGGSGFYRVRHDPATLAALRAALDRLTPVERLALVGDQWALVRADRASVESFLDLADDLAGDLDHDVLDGLTGALAVLDDQVVEPDGAEQAALRRWIAARFGPPLEALGWTAARGEPDEVRLRRAALLRLVGGVAEAPEVLAAARRQIDAYLRDRAALEPNLADPVAALAARVGDGALYDRYRAVAAAALTPQEQRRFLLNLGSFRARPEVRRTLDALLRPEIPTQDVAFLMMRLFGNPAGREEAWRFLQRRWAGLRKRIPPLMVSRMVDATPSLRTPRHARELRAFFRAHPVPEAARAVRQALERFRLNAELRRRTAPGVGKWLAQRGV